MQAPLIRSDGSAELQQLRTALELLPHPVAEYHYRLGLALVANGEPDAGRVELERALELDAGFAKADEAREKIRELEAGDAAGV